MDLSNFQSVRDAAKILADKPINFLFLNAGMVYTSSSGPWLTTNGLDFLMASNFFGHFLLTKLLLPPLQKSKALRRVVITSSIAHWFGNTEHLFRLNHSLEKGTFAETFEVYGTSKLANLLHAYELQRRLKAEGSDVAVIPVTPGLVATEIMNASRSDSAPAIHYWCSNENPAAVAVTRGAETALAAAFSPKPAPPLTFCVPYLFPPVPKSLRTRAVLLLEALQKLTWGPRFARSSPESYDKDLARRLWEHAEKMVA